MSAFSRAAYLNRSKFGRTPTQPRLGRGPDNRSPERIAALSDVSARYKEALAQEAREKAARLAATPRYPSV